MFRKIVNVKKEVAVLDLGTDTICAAVVRGERKEQNKENLGFGAGIRVLGVGYQLAKGLTFGAITNLEELEEAILGAIASAEKEAQKSIKSVFISLPAWAVSSHEAEANVDIGQLPVDDVHISSLTNSDFSRSIGDNEEVIHIMPVSYTIDENDCVQDPTGMIGDKLSAVFHIISVPSSFLKNIRSCLERNDIRVSGFVSSAYASILSTVLEEEATSGVTVVDMGGSSTTISCMQGGVLLYSGIIPLGGRHITNDISMVLKTSRANAERLKILYGVSGVSGEDEGILVSRLDEYGEEHVQNISRMTLDAIISARLEETLKEVEQHIYECGADRTVYQRLVMTGGGSRLSGLSEFIKSRKFFGEMSCRLGKPLGTTGSHDFVKSPSFASAAGTAVYCLSDLASRRLSSVNRSFGQRIVAWFKRGI